MKITHEFLTPRNIFEKLIRDYEQLDIRVSGDNFFNFLSTAYHLQHWIKNAPMHETEQGKRLEKKAAKEDCIKLCKEIVTAKKNYKIIIDDTSLSDENEIDYTKPPAKHDIKSYNDGSKTFKLFVDGEEFDIYKLKDEIMEVYKTYFQIK